MTASRVGSKTPKFGFESFFMICNFLGNTFSLGTPFDAAQDMLCAFAIRRER
jgi:hypothetical protein